MGTPTAATLERRALLNARRPEFLQLLARYSARDPKLFGSTARGTATAGSDIDILVQMEPADGNLLLRASGLLEEARALFGRSDIDILPVQLMKAPVSDAALRDAVDL
ncbi:nucleotidyltransferase family protein [Pseudoclavibacter sp. VKM Ac-2888]|uniref:nucleotidyltransferase family protein n=1 Tax=Pseudoclavibacter sp. VKM Ac-2888 TaxID=2783830 RepID=UPI00188A8BEE|nr:nucleotidyltransferase domain-containing protein [Pseudoclavibacter sp. VKM Ac-2888]MBF4549402.1 nucleotidyltransferase domain-containing protein [Pseudoclavibacter sp. VKM Ac-2888]